MDGKVFGDGEIEVLNPDGPSLLRNAQTRCRTDVEKSTKFRDPMVNIWRDGIQNSGVFVSTYSYYRAPSG